MEVVREIFERVHPRQIAGGGQKSMGKSQINKHNTQMIGERACSYVRVYV